MEKSNPYISVVIPVYSCEDCIIELYRRLKITLEEINSDFEIILVNDASPGNDWEVIKQLINADKRVKGINFSRNFGQHYAITAGLDYSKGEWVVVMDCDLQDQPEDIPRLYFKAKQGFDVVLARRGKRNDPINKRISSWFFYKIFNFFTDMNYDEQIGNYCILSNDVVLQFRKMRERLRFLGGQIKWMGFNSTTIDVKHDVRFLGKSSYTFKKLWKLAYEAIIAYSDKPLKISIKIGFIISFFSFVYGLFIIVRFFVDGTSIEGWSSLIVSIYFIGGLIMANLGIIGIYLGKIFDEIKGRPLYIIKEKKNL